MILYTFFIKPLIKITKILFKPLFIIIEIFKPKKESYPYIIINNIKITKEQLLLLKRYKINYNVKNVEQLLNNIYEESCYCYDDKGIPIPMYENDCNILDDLYNDIKKQN